MKKIILTSLKVLAFIILMLLAVAVGVITLNACEEPDRSNMAVVMYSSYPASSGDGYMYIAYPLDYQTFQVAIDCWEVWSVGDTVDIAPYYPSLK